MSTVVERDNLSLAEKLAAYSKIPVLKALDQVKAMGEEEFKELNQLLGE